MIKKIKKGILSSIKSKRINVFVLFLLLAFIILIFTKLSKEYTHTVSFRIEKTNVPDKYVILNDSVNLNITLKTHGFKWMKYAFYRPKIKIDFTEDVYKKDAVFEWTKSKAFLENTQFDKEVDLLNLSPDTLRFRYGVNLIKKVPVKVNTDIKFSLGYDLAGKVASEPDSITVIGPNIIVSKINFLETEPLTMVDVRTDVNKTVTLKLPDEKANLKFSETKVDLKAKVDKFTEGTLKIPITMINVPQEITLKYFPKTVGVSYYVSLSDFANVTAKDFKVVCDYTKAAQNQSFLIPELVKWPETVKNAKVNQKHIEFIITK
ncbi:YbbR-like domain-containing protein [Flavobacteriaceae bacterium GSB9]|nr:YbbR-like domain-containing protein [Flavobacteriaceae bacterium GSB9]